MAALANVPEYALQSNQALYDYTDPFLLHQLPLNLRAQTIFYLVFKTLLVSVVCVFLVILLKQGKFWLFRVVQVPRGTIICPNACEGLLTFASIFYIGDAVFRGLSLEWFFSSANTQHNAFLFTAVRLIPLWLAGFVHVTAVGLLWPFKPAQLTPVVWHSFFFGLPLSFAAALLPPLIISNRSMNRAQDSFQLLKGRLLAQPTSPVSPSDLDAVRAIGELLGHAYYHARTWAIVGAVFAGILIAMTLSVGPVMMIKIHKEISLQKRNESESSSSEGGDASSTGGGHHRKASSSSQHDVDEDSGQVRRLLVRFRILAGDDIGGEQLKGRPTKKSRIAILSDFLTFTAVQVFCLVALETAMFGVITFFAISILPDLRSTEVIPNYKNQLQRSVYIYHIVEIWSVIAFGTPLILLMLYRQCFPMKVEVHQAVARRSAMSRNVPDIHLPPKTLDEPWPTPSTLNEDNASWHNTVSGSVDTAVPAQSLSQKFKAKRGIKGRSRADSSTSAHQARASGQTEGEDRAQGAIQDVCGYTGTGAGRSIVLEALQHASQYPSTPRKRAAPWQAVSSETSLSTYDVESHTLHMGGLHLYATPHGFVEGVPLCNVSRPDDTVSPANRPTSPPTPSKRESRPRSAITRPLTADSSLSHTFSSASRRTTKDI